MAAFLPGNARFDLETPIKTINPIITRTKINNNP
jgi:hypothetical protein